MSSLPEAFRPSEAAWTRQHHLPGKLRRTGAPTQHPEAGMGCWEVPQSQASKGHWPPAAAASVLPVPGQAAQWSLKEFSKGKSSPAKPGELHLDSRADQAISPVLTGAAELWEQELLPRWGFMSSFQGLGGLAAEKLVEIGAMQGQRQFYFFSSKTVPEVGAACSF